MSFTVLHAIDASSPLWNTDPSSLASEAAELIVTVTGIDETTSQTIHARTSYLADEIRWNRRFEDVFTQTEDGRRALDYRRFHDDAPLQSTPTA
jgi:inward rectifier potassium channel